MTFILIVPVSFIMSHPPVSILLSSSFVSCLQSHVPNYASLLGKVSFSLLKFRFGVFWNLNTGTGFLNLPRTAFKLNFVPNLVLKWRKIAPFFTLATSHRAPPFLVRASGANSDASAQQLHFFYFWRIQKFFHGSEENSGFTFYNTDFDHGG